MFHPEYRFLDTGEMPILVTFQYGIVIRKAALKERDVSLPALLEAMENRFPLDQDSNMLSFGPHFDGEALGVFHDRLVHLGFIYVDDFMELVMDHPDWCKFFVEFSSEG
jgi:hypothetical protein